jgi:cytochrome c556
LQSRRIGGAIASSLFGPSSVNRTVIVRRQIVLALMVIAAVAGAAHAQPDPRLDVKLRRGNFNTLLAAYKVVNAQLKRARPDMAAIGGATDRMAAMARQLPAWFPPGSGPDSGANTNAKPEIWRRPEDFRAHAVALTEAVDRLAAAEKSGNLNSIRERQHAVSASCTACHQAFEERF